MSALTFAFWSFPTHSYWQDFQSQSPGYWVVTDILRCILLCISTVILASKSAAILKLLRQRRCRGEQKASSVYAVVSLVLLAHFVVCTILYCTNVLLALQKAMCAVATWNPRTGVVNTFDWMKCRVFIENGAIRDPVDRVLRLVFALNAQIILSVVNGILAYRVREVYSDMWAVYVPIKVLYVLWIVISFVEMYTVLRFDWLVPFHPRLFQVTFNELKHFSFALSFIFNLLVTITIATRRILQLHGKSTVPAGGSFPLDKGKKPGHYMAKIFLVDSALPATLCSLVVVVAYSQTVVNYSDTAFRVRGVFAVLWLFFSAMAPHLIAIHNLRAEAREFARKAETVVVDKFGHSSFDMDAVSVSTLTYSKDEHNPSSEPKV